jgi:hypothetical protein
MPTHRASTTASERSMSPAVSRPRFFLPVTGAVVGGLTGLLLSVTSATLQCQAAPGDRLASYAARSSAMASRTPSASSRVL